MKFKVFLINFFIFILFYLLIDLIFSNFIFKRSVDHKCYIHVNNGTFYKLRNNCYANMRIISTIDPYKVYTDKKGLRYSGKKRKTKDKNIVFLGDSQTFGVGNSWENTFVGILEEKLENYNMYNLGVPSYSPSVYKYVFKEFLKNNDLDISKVFVLLDLTDVADESNRWYEVNGVPTLTEKKIIDKDRSFFSRFKKENLKGTYIISSKIRFFFRGLKSKSVVKKKNRYKPVDGNPTGSFVYKNHKKLEVCDTDLKEQTSWKCNGIKIGLDKISTKISELVKMVKKKNAEFYLIILPWPDTLNFGQKEFNWESFVNKICEDNNCDGTINMFPDFENLKKKRKDWLEIIYLTDDIHLTKTGNRMLSDKIIKESFKE